MELQIAPIRQAFGLGWSVLNKGGKDFGYFLEKDLSLSKSEEKMLSHLIEHYKSNEFAANVSVEKELLGILKSFCLDGDVLLSKSSAEKIIELASCELAGFGPLDFLLQDENLEEISVIGVKRPIQVYHKEKGWLKSNLQFEDEKTAVNCINKMSRSLGRRITSQSPRINACLPSGERLHASIPPISSEVEITIRKFKSNPLTILDLIRSKTISVEAAAFLWTVLFADNSILIAGNTGSGKTSTLNALFSFIPLNDRIIIVEETPEICIPHEHSVKMVSSEELAISMNEIIKDTLRMRPDRQVMGEVRSELEVKALFDCLLAGQARGTFATFHAQSSEEAIRRLESFGIRKEDACAINLILVQRRIPIFDSVAGNKNPSEIRRVTEICEVLPEGVSSPVFKYDFEKGVLESVCKKPKILDKIRGNYKLKKGESIEGLIQKRSQLLKKLSIEFESKRINFTDLTRLIQES